MMNLPSQLELPVANTFQQRSLSSVWRSLRLQALGRQRSSLVLEILTLAWGQIRNYSEALDIYRYLK